VLGIANPAFGLANAAISAVTGNNVVANAIDGFLGQLGLTTTNTQQDSIAGLLGEISTNEAIADAMADATNSDSLGLAANAESESFGFSEGFGLGDSADGDGSDGDGDAG
jgi:hypothetical protein